jgi:3-oxoacyl-[acyl-carrier protein] reductase
METGLAGQGVVVTGASGGIGSACARAFAAEGARVVVHYHHGRERAEAVAEELGGAPVVGADLTDEAAVEHLFDEARDVLGRVDVCAAVAGVWPSADQPVWELPLARWEATLRANLTATFLTAQAFLREVQRNGHGSLVLVGSTAGRSARPVTPTTRRRSRRSRSACC